MRATTSVDGHILYGELVTGLRSTGRPYLRNKGTCKHDMEMGDSCWRSSRLREHGTGKPLHGATITAPCLRFLAMVLAMVFVQYCRKKGVRCSGVLCFYWFLHLLLAILILRSKIRHHLLEDGSADDLIYTVSFALFSTLLLTQFILSALVDDPPAFYECDPHECPENSASCLSVLTFWWFTRLIITGYRHALEHEDLWSLKQGDSSKEVSMLFEKEWQNEMLKHQRSMKTARRNSAKDHETDIQLTPLQPRNDEGTCDTKIAYPKHTYQPGLVTALTRTFGRSFLPVIPMKLFFDTLTFVNPLLLKLLIGFIADKTQHQWKGFLYVALLFIIALIQSMILHQYFHICFCVGMRVRTAIIAAVYRKALKLSNTARQSSTVGEIVNLMSVDAQRLQELTTYLNMLWSGPFQMAVCLYFLWAILGPSVLAGVAVMVLLLPVNAYIAKVTRKLQVEQMKHKDSRIKLMSEILNGIKVLKLYAWELAFLNKVLGIRKDELKVLKKAAYLNAASSFTWSCAPVLVSLMTFAVYVLSSPDNVLDAEKAFVSLALFNIMRFPLNMLPMLMASLVQASVSVKRLKNFLKNEELDPKNLTIKCDSNYAISVSNGNYAWGGSSDNGTLTNINLQVEDGCLIAVVGVVGSGKSSLLSAILGEMNTLGGETVVKGSVAYAAQQAWIQNATLKENITFGKPLKDSCRYREVLEACALLPDLEILPAGDDTEIGEKGINLSGGQKQRVSLARAVYTDADIYLLDDPLSAVDSHVGKHIFDKVLGPTGLLKDKTRILVTHSVSYLPQVDQIVVISDGLITEQGTYQELLSHKGPFSEILQTYGTEAEEDNSDDDVIIEEITLPSPDREGSHM
ncbi:Multidrug resistance-associated protein 1 [Lamellibrachia satsuma]|nr:Multidrug resistance-associated protein 1 [Lamellibrachia satsuma]